MRENSNGILDVLEDGRNFCQDCEACRMPYYRFCATCGAENPHFDADQFSEQFTGPIDGYNCAAHGWHQQDLFCAVCGTGNQ